MKQFLVELGNQKYPVMIGSDVLARAGRILHLLGFSTAPVVVSNQRVLQLHGALLLRSLEDAFGPVAVLRVGDGERFKQHSTLIRLYKDLIRARADRRSWIVAFGGGVIGDLAGFAAATYMRGIPYVGVPTTLLAQVDSSVGGKVGVNLAEGKNLIGAFHQPRAVLSDTGVLGTLPPREFASGLFEVVKCGAIRSEPLFRRLERKVTDLRQCRSAVVSRIILEATRIKAEVVAEDEREGHARMVLNYGHTLGHALEAASGYRRFKHGEAVAWGMIAAAEFSNSLGMLEARDAARIAALLHRIERLPSLRGISAAQIWTNLRRDKKSVSGSIRMVLLSRLGKAEIVENLNPRCVRRFISEFLGTHQ